MTLFYEIVLMRFIQAFLSNEMMYSCALWGLEEGGVSGDLEIAPSTESSPLSSTATLVTELPPYCAGALEAAQHRKIHHVLKRLRLQRGQRLLEFGSGWGGLAIEAAKTYGVEVDTLTLSVEQKRLAEERIATVGLEGQIRVHLMDYRELPDHWSGLFDAFVSVEMIEVGHASLRTSSACSDGLLSARWRQALRHVLQHRRPRPEEVQRHRHCLLLHLP